MEIYRPSGSICRLMRPIGLHIPSIYVRLSLTNDVRGWSEWVAAAETGKRTCAKPNCREFEQALQSAMVSTDEGIDRWKVSDTCVNDERRWTVDMSVYMSMPICLVEYEILPRRFVPPFTFRSHHTHFIMVAGIGAGLKVAGLFLKNVGCKVVCGKVTKTNSISPSVWNKWTAGQAAPMKRDLEIGIPGLTIFASGSVQPDGFRISFASPDRDNDTAIFEWDGVSVKGNLTGFSVCSLPLTLEWRS